MAKFKIPSHVAAYSLLFSPAFLFWYYYERNNNPEELEAKLKENYKENIRRAQAGNKNMAEFFQHSIHNRDGAVDSQLDSVYKAGKGEVKRHYAVDPKLYGTAEGVAERKRVEAELKDQKRQMRRKKRLAAAGVIPGDDEKKKDENETQVEGDPKAVERKTIQVDATQLAAVTVLAGAAALVGFLAGGSRR